MALFNATSVPLWHLRLKPQCCIDLRYFTRDTQLMRTVYGSRTESTADGKTGRHGWTSPKVAEKRTLQRVLRESDVELTRPITLQAASRGSSRRSVVAFACAFVQGRARCGRRCRRTPRGGQRPPIRSAGVVADRTVLCSSRASSAHLRRAAENSLPASSTGRASEGASSAR